MNAALLRLSVRSGSEEVHSARTAQRAPRTLGEDDPMQIRTATRIAVCFLVTLVGSSFSAAGPTVPFTETFAQNSSNWYNGPGVAPLDWSASGGPEGSAYATTTINFAGFQANAPAVLFRGQDEFNSSSGAFVGDWVTAGVTGFNASVRHNAGAPVNFFVRFASPTNSPGAANVFFIPVPSGNWTSLAAALPNPNLIFEGPFTYGQVFGNIGHVQLGVSVPQGLAGVDAPFSFDIDNIGIVPEPTSLALLAIGVCAIGRRFASRRLGIA